MMKTTDNFVFHPQNVKYLKANYQEFLSLTVVFGGGGGASCVGIRKEQS